MINLRFSLVISKNWSLRTQKIKAKGRGIKNIAKNEWKDKITQPRVSVTQNLIYKKRKGTKITSLPSIDPIISLPC